MTCTNEFYACLFFEGPRHSFSFLKEFPTYILLWCGSEAFGAARQNINKIEINLGYCVLEDY